MFHRCYVDEVLALLSSLDHADKFEKYFSSKYPNINLFKEKGKKMVVYLFKMLAIFHENDKFASNVYRKKTFIWVYTKFKSFIPESYNIDLIKSLLF